jgi:hypothetical protein
MHQRLLNTLCSSPISTAPPICATVAMLPFSRIAPYFKPGEGATTLPQDTTIQRHALSVQARHSDDRSSGLNPKRDLVYSRAVGFIAFLTIATPIALALMGLLSLFGFLKAVALAQFGLFHLAW